MFSNSTNHSPAELAGRLLINTVNISKKTKDFLEGEVISTVLDLSRYEEEKIEQISCRHIRREIQDFKNYVMQWMNRETPRLRFSRNIPSPKIKRRILGEEKITLMALLLGEPLFGNRRNIAEARRQHLPDIYGPDQPERKKYYPFPFKTLRRYELAS